jgi:hypothetical protein
MSPYARLLPDLFPRESLWRRSVGWMVALCVCALYATMLFGYVWSPAHPGVDQAGYLVGGKSLARTGSTGMTVTDPLEFVSNMYVLNPKTDTYYPKYPIGLPVLYAACLKVLGETHGAVAAHALSPAAATLGMLGMFLLARRFGGSFAGVMAMLLLGFGQTYLVLAINPNSHAISTCVIVWGMLMLVRWMQTARVTYGALAGLLLGFAVMVRYSDGLLALCIAFASLSMLRWTNWRSYLVLIVPTVCWWAVVLVQLLCNWMWLGTISSYDNTNESVGFSLENLGKFWERTVYLLSGMNLFLVAPIGVMGIVAMLLFRARAAVVLLVWLVPSVLLYTAYYWPQDVNQANMSWGRFLMSSTPALIVACAWLMGRMMLASPAKRGAAVGAGTLVAIACGVASARAIPMWEMIDESRAMASRGPETARNWLSESRVNADLYWLGQEVLRRVPRGSMLIAEDTLLHHLQFVGDYKATSEGMLDEGEMSRRIENAAKRDEDDPDPIDPKRIERMKAFYGPLDEDQLLEKMSERIRKHAAAGGRTFAIVRQRSEQRLRSHLQKMNLKAGERLRFDQSTPALGWQDALRIEAAELRESKVPTSQQSARLKEIDQILKRPITNFGRRRDRNRPATINRAAESFFIIELLVPAPTTQATMQPE